MHLFRQRLKSPGAAVALLCFWHHDKDLSKDLHTYYLLNAIVSSRLVYIL